jgi:ABC-2 type transport system permease protein
MKKSLILIYYEFLKLTKIWLSYPIIFLFFTVFPLIWVLPFVFQGKALVGSFSSVPFKELTGTENYLAFLLLGSIVSTYVFSGLWGVGNSLREETYWGTLEYLILSPTNPLIILIGKTLTEFVYATITVVIQALIIVLILNIKITLIKLLPVILIILLLLIGFYGFAIAFAGFTLLLKEVEGWIRTLEWVFYLFSPIRYPVEINPLTKFISSLIPLTYALVAIRAVILLNKNILSLKKILFILGIIDILLIIIAIFLFKFLEKKTRELGTIGGY